MPEFRKDVGDVGFTAGPSGPSSIDTSVAEGLAFLGETAGKLGEGKALAELEGAEEFAKETEVGGEIDINQELDLTKITRARKQGKLSGQEALTRAQASVKKAVNANPLFASAIRQRAQEFFTGGGLGSGNIFEATAEEKLQASLAKQEAVAIQKEIQEARGLGKTVEELRDLKGTILVSQAKSARLSAQQAQGKVDSQTVLNGMDGDTELLSLSVMGQLQQAVVSQGGVSPDRKVQIITGINLEFARKSRDYKKLLQKANTPTSEINAAMTYIKNEKESMIQSIEDGSLEALIKSKSSTLQSAIAGNALLSHTDVATVRAVAGESGATLYLQSLTSKRLEAVLHKFHPSIGKAGGAAKSNFLTPLIQSIYKGTPISSEQTQIKAILGSEIAKSSDAEDNDVDKGLAALSEAALDSPESIREWQDPTIIAKIKRNPKLQKHVSNVADSVKASLLSSSLTQFGGGFPVDGVSTAGELMKDLPPRARPKGAAARQPVFTYKGKPIPEFRSELNSLLTLTKTYPEIFLRDKTIEEWMQETINQLNPQGEAFQTEEEKEAARPPSSRFGRSRRAVKIENGKAKLAK